MSPIVRPWSDYPDSRCSILSLPTVTILLVGALYTPYLIVGLGSDYPAGQYHVCGSSSLLGLRSSEDIVTIVQACRLEQLLQQWMLTINRDSVTRFFFLHDSCPTYICCSIFAHGLHFVEKFTCSKKKTLSKAPQSQTWRSIFFLFQALDIIKKILLLVKIQLLDGWRNKKNVILIYCTIFLGS